MKDIPFRIIRKVKDKAKEIRKTVPLKVVRKKKKKNKLTSKGVYLDNYYYGLIMDYPFDKVKEKGPDALQKAVAYRYHKEMTIMGHTVTADYLMPYRGILEKGQPLTGLKPGFYFTRIKHNQYKETIIRPRTPEEKEMYHPSQEKDMIYAMVSGEIDPDEFSDNQLNMADIGTDVYLPPIHVDDDSLNMLLKLAIRLKGASFAPYGKRLEAQVGDSNSTAGANKRNNVKRAMWLNNSLSPNKFCEYTDAWELEPAIVLRNRPGAMHPMRIPDGMMLGIFPHGTPFEINSDMIMNSSDMITDAILSSSTEERTRKAA